MVIYLKRHRTAIFIQLIVLLIICVSFIMAKVQYFSTITVYPLQITEISPSEGVQMKRYTPEYTMQLFLKELSKDGVRMDAYKNFLLKNKVQCKDQKSPNIKFYEKSDSSFPIVSYYITIEVKSTCKNLSNKFVEFLPGYMNEMLANKIQDVENINLGRLKDNLILKLERDLQDARKFLSNRKEILKKIVKLTGNKNKPRALTANQKTLLNIRGDRTSTVFNVDIPLSYEAAEAELNFLSSVSNYDEISIDMINRMRDIERYSIKQNFQGARLVHSSSVSSERKSKRSLFLSLFFAIITLSLGFLVILLNEIMFQKKRRID